MITSEQITHGQLCKLFDHSNLHAFASNSDMDKLCKEASDINCAMVAINSAYVAYCKEKLHGNDVNVGAAISFPLGQTTLDVKVFETENAIKNGADEIDYVINIGELKNDNLDYIRLEMSQIVSICRDNNVTSKVIYENCYLTKKEIVTVSEISRELKTDFVKTSTCFGTSGATPEDVALMKSIVGDDIKVKAAGGIRSWETCAKMINAGAQRIGTSSMLKIIEEYEVQNE
ncbi:MAG: deoxyribose-phosphate aldolase [Suipraeoptans sp.]